MAPIRTSALYATDASTASGLLFPIALIAFASDVLHEPCNSHSSHHPDPLPDPAFEITPASTDDREGLRDGGQCSNFTVLADKGYVGERLMQEMQEQNICLFCPEAL